MSLGLTRDIDRSSCGHTWLSGIVVVTSLCRLNVPRNGGFLSGSRAPSFFKVSSPTERAAFCFYGPWCGHPELRNLVFLGRSLMDVLDFTWSLLLSLDDHWKSLGLAPSLLQEPQQLQILWFHVPSIAMPVGSFHAVCLLGCPTLSLEAPKPKT